MNPIFANYGGYLSPWAVEIVHRYRDRGHSPSQIADWLWTELPPPDRMSVSSTQVAYVLRRVGVYQAPLPASVVAQQREDEVQRLRDEGLTLEAIGQRIGRSKERVRQMVMKNQRRRKDAAERVRRRERHERILAEMYAPKPPPKGRPIDMGGPRDVWLDRSPWDAQ